jgi:DNA-binding GntR family transcriptional regulator
MKSPRARAPAEPGASTAPVSRRTASARGAAKAPGRAAAKPIYQRVADQLRQAISAGRYPVGTRLPTEMELCEQLGISRFTARGAVRLLLAEGLVTRRTRIGTIVTALPGAARYSQDVSSVQELLQYARDTELRLAWIGRIGLSKAFAREFGAEAGEEWIYALGVRYDPRPTGGAPPARPICVSRIFLNPQLKGIEGKLRTRKSAIYALIEREYRIGIKKVDQEIRAVLLDADDAANLGCEAGSPGLRILRRYYSDDGVLLEAAENIHPGERFTYHMQLRR